jgi:hypothetical protein
LWRRLRLAFALLSWFSRAVLLYSIYWFRNICRYTLARFESAIFYERPVGPKECKMRNVSCVGLCWVMTLGLVAVALGQQRQPADTWQNAPQAPPPGIDTTGMPVERALQAGQQGGEWQQREARPMEAPQGANRSPLTGSYRPDADGTDAGQRRGELGIWMGESGGPGVQILRVTSDSAAAQAGLRVGDIILQVNGQGASSPQEAAKLIRQIGIGQSGSLMVWRDGNQQQVQVTLQPVRDSARRMASEAPRQVGFGRSESADSDLASRMQRLEQQINSLTQELASLRQELTQLRSTGPVQTGYSAPANQSVPLQEPPARYEASKAAVPPPADAAAPPPGFAAPVEKPAKPAADAPKPAAPPAAAPAAAAKKSSSTDLFGSDAAQPKSQEKPKAEEKPKTDDKGGSDDLFK